MIYKYKQYTYYLYHICCSIFQLIIVDLHQYGHLVKSRFDSHSYLTLTNWFEFSGADLQFEPLRLKILTNEKAPFKNKLGCRASVHWLHSTGNVHINSTHVGRYYFRRYETQFSIGRWEWEEPMKYGPGKLLVIRQGSIWKKLECIPWLDKMQ